MVTPVHCEPPPGCDAYAYGASATVTDGQCRCLVCPRCGHHTGSSSQGHYWALCQVTRALRAYHFCCPDPAFGCELPQPAASSP